MAFLWAGWLAEGLASSYAARMMFRVCGLLLVLAVGTAHAVPVKARHIKQLRALEASLLVAQAQLASLTTQVNAIEADVANTRESLMGDVNQFHVVARDMARLARVPAESHMLANLESNTPPRTGLLRQARAGLVAHVEEQQDTLNGLLLQQAELRQLQTAQLAAAEVLTQQKNKLAGVRNQALTQLMGDPNQLAARLQAFLPQGIETMSDSGAVTRLTPVVGEVPVKGFVVPQAGVAAGLTFMAAPAADVRAITAGTVAFSGPFREFGNLLIVAVGTETHHVYGGLGHMAVQVGETVSAQQVLGTLPNQPEPQLYVEIRHAGKPQRLPMESFTARVK
ncbi:MAG: peptidoglycan DD-metalloendopeptidase family protein [Alphaproteobacteria bacterium]